ncbi:membrane-associated protein [Cellulomonas flavigena DSM 20109]|uniref:Membrane-associated protein n=1 Tax=Cellulomonas flavigena (strain ATCC 482 / DSM 20109 / BCRC 11376 / JCM 18109 / NBRC 3775 / NCIMB 8073 / NRS 134) TaxID=446466 RepID=D5UG54_CELFN|nr:membrane protein [Cellulomonas flavigena]ADG75077.1 membrane-associated protein [Cellulomonas flavigena DSM 20109]
MTSTQVLAGYGLDGLPVVVALACLFGIVMARSHLTYWAGRGVARGARREGEQRRGPRGWQRVVDRTARLSATPSARRGVAIVHRWGPVAVTLAYLTVGVQTTVFAGAGLLRMPYLRFTLASVPGALAWAVVWGTVGIGAVWGALALAAGSPAGLAALVVVVAVVVTTIVTLTRRRRRGEPRLAVGPPAGPRAAPGGAEVDR